MADFQGIAAAGESLRRHLNQSFREREPIPGRQTTAVLVRSEDFGGGNEAAGVIVAPAVSIYLYRVKISPVTRAAWAAVSSQDGEAHLPLDLHYLLSPWADNANHEQRILGRVIQCLEEIPILGGPLLDPLGDWAANEAIQVCLEELSTEDLMRTFDTLPIDYKLSLPYVARIMRLDGRSPRPARPVTTLAAGSKASVEP